MDDADTLVLWLMAAVAATLVLSLLLQVDNWKRDLFHNEAETSDDASDPVLRPVRIDQPLEQVVEAVRAVANDLRGWEFVDQRWDDEGTLLHFVRITPVFRFRDDITIRIVAASRGGSEVHAHSASRLGMGDLGQNPRNLKELLVPLREVLQESVEF